MRKYICELQNDWKIDIKHLPVFPDNDQQGNRGCHLIIEEENAESEFKEKGKVLALVYLVEI